jgi:hypothetical protein
MEEMKRSKRRAPFYRRGHRGPQRGLNQDAQDLRIGRIKIKNPENSFILKILIQFPLRFSAASAVSKFFVGSSKQTLIKFIKEG